MINKTSSKVVVELYDIDNARKLFESLKRIGELGSMGGDLEIKIDDEKFYIGHDVTFLDITHEIKEK